MFDVNAVRADFPGSTQQVYLNAAGVGLPPRAALDAVQQAAPLQKRNYTTTCFDLPRLVSTPDCGL